MSGKILQPGEKPSKAHILRRIRASASGCVPAKRLSVYRPVIEELEAEGLIERVKSPSSGQWAWRLKAGESDG